MENVDTCVQCGNIVPEGTMVCPSCANKYKEFANDYTVVKFATTHLGVELRWYQKILLKMYELSVTIPRKGLHR